MLRPSKMIYGNGGGYDDGGLLKVIVNVHG
jgi:hypothetical protein